MSDKEIQQEPSGGTESVSSVHFEVAAGKVSLTDRIGKRLRLGFAGFFYALGYFIQVIRDIPRFFRRRQAGYRVLVMQILFTGVEALGVISIIALSLGVVIIVIAYSFREIVSLAQADLMYPLLVIIITRELGPVLTAFIIVARSGTAIATELGNMVVSHEIEAYIASGVNPISYLVVPRLLGVVIANLVLSVYFSLFGLLGSYFIAAFVADIPIEEYLRKLLIALSAGDVILSLVKAFVFGSIVALISTYEGFRVNRSSTEIPQAGIRAVSKSFVWTIVADALITVVYYIVL